MGPNDDDTWLRNMPSDKDAGWGTEELKGQELQELADVLPTPGMAPSPIPSPEEALATTVEEADKAIGGWKSVRSQVIVHKPDCHGHVVLFSFLS
jgi:hypothetical protein